MLIFIASAKEVISSLALVCYV